MNLSGSAPHIEKLYDTTPNKLAVFALPRQLLKELWLRAFRTQWRRVTTTLRQGTNVIFTCHLCYFHHLSREYITVANLAVLTKRLRSRSGTTLIALIDDVYDCCRRLSQQGRLLAARTPEEALLDALSVLDWRLVEILLADAVATAAGLRHYLFAVKHSKSTFYDLLYSGKPTAYLSSDLRTSTHVERRPNAEDRGA